MCGCWGVDNANRMVYDRLATWLVAAFNGEFERWVEKRPKEEVGEYDPNEDDDDEHEHDGHGGDERKGVLVKRGNVEGRGRRMLRREVEMLGGLTVGGRWRD